MLRLCYIAFEWLTSRLATTGDRLADMYPRISQGRRLLGITIDWIACLAISLGFFAGHGSYTERVPHARIPVLILLFAEYALLVAFGGASFGHRVVGLKVVRFSDGGAPTPIQALIRAALLMPLITAITFDENGRGVNERLSNTVLVKTR